MKEERKRGKERAGKGKTRRGRKEGEREEGKKYLTYFPSQTEEGQVT